jgi:hypothetical protein
VKSASKTFCAPAFTAGVIMVEGIYFLQLARLIVSASFISLTLNTEISEATDGANAPLFDYGLRDALFSFLSGHQRPPIVMYITPLD